MTVAARKALAHGYDEDFVAWSSEQAALLRAGRWAELDIDHIAEEIESLGRSDRRALASHVQVVLLHLLKWQFQPSLRGSSWRQSIRNGRIRIAKLVKESPSLRRELPGFVTDEYQAARADAADETGLPLTAFPQDCPYTVEQILDPEFVPE